MATPFKLKSGNTSSFKNMGSSPVKAKGDNLKRIMSEKKALAKKTGTFYAPDAEPKINDPSKMPKDFNTKGSKGSTTPDYKSTKAKNIDFKSKGKFKFTGPKTNTQTGTNIGPSDKYGKIGQVGKDKFIKNSGGRSNANHPYKGAATQGATKPSKVSKVVNLVKNKAKKVLNHPTTKKILKVGGKFGGAVFNIMPPPLVNPNTKYNKRQEG